MSEAVRTQIDDGKITLTMPENFHVLSAQEITEMGVKPTGSEWAVKNDEKHLIYSITWKKASFLTMGMSLETIVDNTDKQLRKRNPTLKDLGTVGGTIAGQKVAGLRYSYTVKDVHMVGEYLLIKYAKQYIAFACMAREESYDEHRPIFKQMLESIELH